MTSAFAECCAIERRGVAQLEPLLRMWCADGRFVFTDKGRLSPELQREYGDAFATNRNGELAAIEFKVEQEERYGNFFLETWSNRSRRKTGWMYNLRADWLWYFFDDTKHLYTINFPKLQEWAFDVDLGREVRGKLFTYPERAQSKYDQKNDTWGRCVPIVDIIAAVGLKKWRVHDGTAQPLPIPSPETHMQLLFA